MKLRASPTRPTILQALRDPDLFGPLKMDGPTWKAWRVILAAAYGLRLNAREIDLFKQLTKRSAYNPPRGGWRIIAVIAARQCGKSQVAGVVTDYESLFPVVESPNLRAVLVAQSEDDVKATMFRYARFPFDKSETLAESIAGETTTSITLNTGVVVHALPCKPAAVRGPSAVIAVLDEPAHYRATSGDPLDAAVIEAAEPSLFATKGKLWLLSSPYAEYGRLYELHRDFYGKDDPRVLVIQSDSLTLNPTLDKTDLDEFRRVNPDAATSEVDGLFRANLSKLFDPATLQACVEASRQLRAPVSGIKYTAFVDSASGGKTNLDRFAVAVAHADGTKTVLDRVMWWMPPFSTTKVIADIAALIAPYGIRKVFGDRHGKGFIEERFAEPHKITYEETDAKHSASENYLQLEKMVNTCDAVLLDQDEVLREFRNLDRVRSSTGDRVDHPRGCHDDAACAVAGAMVYAREAGGRRTGIVDSATVAAVAQAMSERMHPRVARSVIDECIHPHERVGV